MDRRTMSLMQRTLAALILLALSGCGAWTPHLQMVRYPHLSGDHVLVEVQTYQSRSFPWSHGSDTRDVQYHLLRYRVPAAVPGARVELANPTFVGQSIDLSGVDDIRLLRADPPRLVRYRRPDDQAASPARFELLAPKGPAGAWEVIASWDDAPDQAPKHPGDAWECRTPSGTFVVRSPGGKAGEVIDTATGQRADMPEVIEMVRTALAARGPDPFPNDAAPCLTDRLGFCVIAPQYGSFPSYREGRPPPPSLYVERRAASTVVPLVPLPIPAMAEQANEAGGRLVFLSVDRPPDSAGRVDVVRTDGAPVQRDIIHGMFPGTCGWDPANRRVADSETKDWPTLRVRVWNYGRGTLVEATTDVRAAFRLRDWHYEPDPGSATVPAR